MKHKALTIVGWIISAAAIAALFARLDLREIAHTFAHASGWFLAAAALLNLAVVAIKALRWQWLMRPAHRAHFGEIFEITMIDLAGNNVLPARGGDLVRIYLLGRWKGVSKATLASITGLDKLFDGVAILILFGALSFHSTFPEWVERGTLIVAIVTAVAFLLCALLLFHHRRALAGHTGATSRISRIASRLGAGMAVLAHKRMIAATLFISLASCLMQIETIRLCQLAFGLHLDLWVPALVFVAINLAIIVPAAPSGVGPFEVAAVLAYAWLHLNAEMGFAVALSYHLVQFLPVTAIGLVLYVRLVGRNARRHAE
jgi:glycosyltransferase 2 family protein